MGFVVGSTFITWLLVVIIAFGARSTQTIDNAKDKIQEKERQQ